MKVLREFVIFSYWGFIARLEVGGERHGFSKVDLQMVINMRSERNHGIWKYYQEFPHNDGYCKQITKFSEFNKFQFV